MSERDPKSWRASVIAWGSPTELRPASHRQCCSAQPPDPIPGVQLVKIPPAMLETWVQSLGWEDPLEKGKATHSSILAWRIPWTV